MRLVHLNESLLHRLVVSVKFVDEFLFQRTSCDHLSSNLLAWSILQHRFLHVALKLGILRGVVPEVETFCWLNDAPKPATEVSKVHATLIVFGAEFNKHLEKVVIKLLRADRATKNLCKFLCCHVAIIVKVKIKKSLAD